MATVAIVGAGPSGCFVAQALLKLRPDSRITIVDALAVPYGLVRYGVAGDHQGTKAVTRQFDRLFDRQGVVFAGGVALGQDVTLEALRARRSTLAVGFAWAAQEAESLPIEPTDQPLDAIITELGARVFAHSVR